MPEQGGKEVWGKVIPNPRLKLMDQVREVMRLKHYSLRTERCYCDWIRRYVKFHGMRVREELFPAEGKIELFLSDLAVRGQVAGEKGGNETGRAQSGGRADISHHSSHLSLTPG